MKIFTVKHGKYEQHRIGCDYCGEPKEVKGYKHPAVNFQHIYLCHDCWPLLIDKGNI